MYFRYVSAPKTAVRLSNRKSVTQSHSEGNPGAVFVNGDGAVISGKGHESAIDALSGMYRAEFFTFQDWGVPGRSQNNCLAYAR